LPLVNRACGNRNVCLPSCLPQQMKKDSNNRHFKPLMRR
jgi:hypothetical protein